jgi:hypothetical protein
METPDILVGPGTQFAQGEKSLYPGQCHDIKGSVSRELRGVKSVIRVSFKNVSAGSVFNCYLGAVLSLS